MTWKASGEPKQVGPATVRYLRSAQFQEGAWDVAIGERTLRILPDGRTSGNKRSRSIVADLADIYAGIQALGSLPVAPADDSRSFAEPDPLAYLVGRLILEGCTTIELDGQPLLPASGQWQVSLGDHGRVSAVFVGGGSGG